MTPQEKAEAIIDMLSSRGGFDGWWGNIDDDTQEEIIEEITKIMKTEETNGITGLYTQEYVDTQNELIQLLYSQVADLTMMSKIELGNDVIEEIKRLKNKLNPQ